MKDFWSRYGTWLLALLVFIAVSFIYCAPSLDGKIISAGDVISGNAAAHETSQFYAETGENTYWTGSLFSGMPNYQVSCRYESAKWLKPLRRVLVGNRVKNCQWALFMYFLCFFILLRSLRVDKSLSMVGALAMGLSSYFLIIIPAGHFFKVTTIPLMSVTAAGFVHIFRKRYLPGMALTCVCTAVGFIDHPQMSYYILMMVGLFWLAELAIHIREKRMKDFVLGTLLFGVSLAVGLGANSASVFANKEYASQTMRGGHSDLVKAEDAQNKTKGLDLDYATQWSYGIGESLSFLVPGARGGASGYDVGTDSKLYETLVKHRIDRRTAEQFCSQVPLYWGDQPFTSGNVYMGAIVCFLFVLGLIVVKSPYKWALAIATLLSVMLAWGNHFMPLTEFFFKYFPMYNKFRAVSSILIVAEITMPLLGFMALRDLSGDGLEKRFKQRALLTAAGITGGICLVLALFAGSLYDFTAPGDASYASQLPDFVYQAILDERKALLVSDSFRSLLFILGAAFVIWLYISDKLKASWMTGILCVLVVADMWGVDKRYFNDSHFVTPKQNKAVYTMMPYEKQILADPDPHFRVFNLTTNTFNEARTSYYLKHIGGYNAAKLRRYQDLIDEHLSKMNMNVISMLNTKYIIVKGQDGQPTPMANPDAMGNAWYVDSLYVVDNANEESEALRSLDLRTSAVLDREFAGYLPEGLTQAVSESGTCLVRPEKAESSVRLTNYAPNALDYVCRSSQPSTIVFSEIYYPFGWKASIDGQPADHYRVDYLLRALNVPAGEHQIRFVFDPDSVKKGNVLSLTCIFLMYAFVLFALGTGAIRLLRLRRNEK